MVLLMKEPLIQNLFPTPVYISMLNRKLNKKELSFIDKIKSDTYKNEGNTTSNNNYILEEKEFSKLKLDLDLIVQDYFNRIVSPKNNIEPYITQSWLNYTNKNEYHHMHAHPNSLISGVFYINSNDKFDKIKFFKQQYEAIQLETKEWNIWNSKSWWFPVKTGDIILFPSSLTHMVENKQGDNTRISLAFNVFIKGTIGNNKDLTELTVY
jgi:uncharacterized protein (TIGR02466 family)